MALDEGLLSAHQPDAPAQCSLGGLGSWLRWEIPPDRDKRRVLSVQILRPMEKQAAPMATLEAVNHVLLSGDDTKHLHHDESCRERELALMTNAAWSGCIPRGTSSMGIFFRVRMRWEIVCAIRMPLDAAVAGSDRDFIYTAVLFFLVV